MTTARSILKAKFDVQLKLAHCGIVAKRLSYGDTLEGARSYATALIIRWFEGVPA